MGQSVGHSRCGAWAAWAAPGAMVVHGMHVRAVQPLLHCSCSASLSERAGERSRAGTQLVLALVDEERQHCVGGWHAMAGSRHLHTHGKAMQLYELPFRLRGAVGAHAEQEAVCSRVRA